MKPEEIIKSINDILGQTSVRSPRWRRVVLALEELLSSVQHDLDVKEWGLASPDIREKIAELIHDEWQKWAENIMPELEKLTENHVKSGSFICKCKTCQRMIRWKAMFVHYSELPEEIKDYDRPWADQITPILQAKVEEAKKIKVLSDEEIEAEVNFESVAKAQLAHTIKEIKGVSDGN